ncbi:hypothetical protein I546_7303 [Mycobacterium kansasii 732]|nr:hypothetical protein I546_7303 [Mycobacterium kansasii 732]
MQVGSGDLTARSAAASTVGTRQTVPALVARRGDRKPPRASRCWSPATGLG